MEMDCQRHSHQNTVKEPSKGRAVSINLLASSSSGEESKGPFVDWTAQGGGGGEREVDVFKKRVS